MFKHIFKIIKTQRKSNAWVFVELLIIFILLWCSVDGFLMQGITALQPEGVSVENVCKVTLAVRPQTSASYIQYPEGSEEIGDNFLRIIDRLRAHPDVEAVTFGLPYAAPFNYTNSSSRYWNDTIASAQSYDYNVSPDYFRVFDIYTADGGSPELLTGAMSDGWVISQTLAEKLGGPDRREVRQLAHNKDDSVFFHVRAVSAPLKKKGIDQPLPITFIPIKEKDVYGESERELAITMICFRLRPGVAGSTEYADRFKKEMKLSLAAGNFWLADVQYYPDLRRRFLDNSLDMAGRRLNIAVNLFLLVNVFLAVIGTFWFRVNRRRGELGLRMALGSSRSNLRRLVMYEGLLLMTLAAIPALLVCFNLAYLELLSTEVMKITAGRLLVVSLLTWGILAAIICLAVWYPSRKASRLEPAEALHYE